MKISEKPLNVLDRIGRWAMPRKPEEQRVFDITTGGLLVAAVFALIYFLLIR